MFVIHRTEEAVVWRHVWCVRVRIRKTLEKMLPNPKAWNEFPVKSINKQTNVSPKFGMKWVLESNNYNSVAKVACKKMFTDSDIYNVMFCYDHTTVNYSVP